MHMVIAKLTVKPEHEARLLTLLRADAEGTRAEQGCVRFDVARAGANVFVLCEVYRDREAFAEHQKTPHFLALFSEAQALLEGPPEATFGDLEPI